MEKISYKESFGKDFEQIWRKSNFWAWKLFGSKISAEHWYIVGINAGLNFLEKRKRNKKRGRKP